VNRDITEENPPVTTLTAETTTKTLDVPGATLTYDVRPGSGPDATPLFLIGSPMGAGGFGSLASRFGDRTIVTYDPRGTERSTLTDPTSRVSPDEHSEDIHRIVQEVGGPVDVFASSGGAVNALALVANHPDDVRTLVAHEPPLASLVPDSEHALAACRAVHETYMRSGSNAGMAHFIAIVTHRAEFTPEVVARPAPDPAMFGMPTDDDGDRNDAMLGKDKAILTLTGFEPNFDALRASSARIILAAGEGSEGELANRGAYAAAKRLGADVTVFPSDHGGFLGGEYGQTGKPDEFAAKLRDVLAG
jgi:pimeloyl-ACP methyl ester carboxylesterase